MINKVSIIIPVYNEEKYVYTLLQELVKVNFLWLWIQTEIIIINDGSIDWSHQQISQFIAEYPKQNIIYHQQENAWKWATVKKWISLSTGDIIVIQDADLEYDPFDLLEGLQILKEKNLDMIYGSRIRGFARHWFTYSTIPFLLWGIIVSLCASIATKTFITDEPTCYKMFSKKCKPLLLLPSENGFEREPAVTLAVLRSGYKYGERPIKYFPRKTTAGKKIKFKDGIKALQTTRKRRKGKPLP